MPDASLPFASVSLRTPLPLGSGLARSHPATGVAVVLVPAVRHGNPGVNELSDTSGAVVVGPLKLSDSSTCPPAASAPAGASSAPAITAAAIHQYLRPELPTS